MPTAGRAHGFLRQQLSTWDKQETSLRFNTAQDKSLTLHNPIQTAAFPTKSSFGQFPFSPPRGFLALLSYSITFKHPRASQSGAASPDPRDPQTTSARSHHGGFGRSSCLMKPTAGGCKNKASSFIFFLCNECFYCPSQSLLSEEPDK